MPLALSRDDDPCDSESSHSSTAVHRVTSSGTYILTTQDMAAAVDKYRAYVRWPGLIEAGLVRLGQGCDTLL